MLDDERRARAAAALRPMSYEKFARSAGAHRRVMAKKVARRALRAYLASLAACAVSSAAALAYLAVERPPSVRELTLAAVVCLVSPPATAFLCRKSPAGETVLFV